MEMVEPLETIKASRLYEELDRLAERWCDEPVALQVIDAVRLWAVEETVPDVDSSEFLNV